MIDYGSKIRAALRRLGRALAAGSAGQSVVEFAVALPFLIMMGIGTFAVGIIIDRHLTVGQLVRNGGNMFARGVSFVSNQNKQFLVDAADGMGMTLTGGTAVVYLSLLQRVPPTARCGSGACANAGMIVIAQRFAVGNASLAPSKFGMPAQLDAEGNHLRRVRRHRRAGHAMCRPASTTPRAAYNPTRSSMSSSPSIRPRR